MEQPVSISNLNDFVFCPTSIYFHQLYGDYNTMMLQNTDQRNGTFAHESLDFGGYSSRKDILTGISVYSEKYNLIGKIDCYDRKNEELIERKKKIKVIYDGYVFQLYGQYFSMKEMGYPVKRLFLYSYDDNKKYAIPLPEDDPEMFLKFVNLMKAFHEFQLSEFNRCGQRVRFPKFNNPIKFLLL